MRRVVVVGSPGSGKSTFSKILGDKTGLPVIHLDYYHLQSEHSYPVNIEKWNLKVSEMVREKEWIMDRNYGASYPQRFELADTIIFFDIPRRTCFYRILKRYFYYQNRKRTEMPDDWKEKLDLGFLKYVWRFNKYSKPKIMSQIKIHNNETVKIFRKSGEASAWLKTVELS